jgi:hypothetical protein
MVLAQRRKAVESGCRQAYSGRVDHALDIYHDLNIDIDHALRLRLHDNHQQRNWYARRQRHNARSRCWSWYAHGQWSNAGHRDEPGRRDTSAGAEPAHRSGH